MKQDFTYTLLMLWVCFKRSGSFCRIHKLICGSTEVQKLQLSVGVRQCRRYGGAVPP